MSEKISLISYPIHVARLPQRGMTVSMEAELDQRVALAAAHDLLEVSQLRAEVVVTGWKKGGVKVSGRVRANVVQACVLSLEPVESTIDEEVSAIFVPEGSHLSVPKASADGEILLDAEGDDAPETFSGDTIDVGALVEEFFELGIDPYPRKPGVSLDAPTKEPEPERHPLGEKLLELRKKL